MSYENQSFTLHQNHKTKNPNCEYCAKSSEESLEEMGKNWDVESPESRVKTIPIPKGFVSDPRRGDGNHY